MYTTIFTTLKDYRCIMYINIQNIRNLVRFSMSYLSLEKWQTYYFFSTDYRLFKFCLDAFASYFLLLLYETSLYRSVI